MRALVPGLVTLLLAASLFAQNQNYSPADIRRVVLVEGNQSVQMKDNVASSKTSWSVVVSKQLYSFKGAKSQLRTKTNLPEFQFETDAAFDDPDYLFRFDVRSDRREIRVARGSGGLAEMTIPKDHLIETRSEEIGSEQPSTKRYRLKPVVPLLPGEYCLGRRISICYDFGVD